MLDLMARRLDRQTAAARLTARLTVEAAPDAGWQRHEETVAWSPDPGPGRYAVPESSAWVHAPSRLARVVLAPDEASPLADSIEFEWADGEALREALDECWREGRAVDDPGLPAYGEFVAVDEFPEAIAKVRARYPAALRGTGQEGTVIVQALVDSTGRIADAVIAKSNRSFDAAAVEAVRQYRFKPARSSGRPVAVWVAVPLRFVAE